MRRKAWIGFLLVTVGLLAYGCVPQQPTQPGDINVNVNNSATNNNGQNPGTGASPGTGGPCLPVARVGVKLHGSQDTRASSAPIGTVVTLDATNKDAADNIRPDSCNLATPIAWGVAGPCTILDGSSYTPNIKGNAVGVCYVSATVSGITSNSYELTVTAAAR